MIYEEITQERIDYALQSRHKFTIEEDKRLKELVEEKGLSFIQVSSLMPGRSTRQCRERYKYFLSPNYNKESWNPEEDKIILEKYLTLGPKWSLIASCLDKRASIDVKNRYRKLKRRKANYLIFLKDTDFSLSASEEDSNSFQIRHMIELPTAISKLKP